MLSNLIFVNLDDFADADLIESPISSTSGNFVIDRAYYKTMRLLAYLFSVGGLDGDTGNPTDSVEKHAQ